jgi:hypothetical protein
MNAKGAELMSLEKEMKEKVFLGFSRDHAQSPVALFALEQFVGEDPDINVQLVEPVFNQLPERFVNLWKAMNFEKDRSIEGYSDRERSTGIYTTRHIGQTGQPFVFQGQYVLLILGKLVRTLPTGKSERSKSL